MKLPKLKTLLLTPVILFVLFYALAAIVISNREHTALESIDSPRSSIEIAIFGASGTAGDGILEAALASPNIANIKVITRRVTPRMQAGVEAGKVQLTLHDDYLDYAALQSQFANLDAVYWAIGINSLGVDEETYGKIHVDFPMQFVREWVAVSNKTETSFHYISSSDISQESTAMWAREKLRAENSLFEFAKTSKLTVIAYRPDYIGPTKQEAHIGQNLLYWFFKPVGAAVRATEIGRAMIDVTLRGSSVKNGTKLNTREILIHAEAY